MAILIFTVCLLASVAGSICGIGGGVIIKPVLDFWGIASVAAASFLSGCTVLSMSLYNVGGNLAGRSAGIELRTGTPLALGAAVGGLLGSQLFTAVQAMFENPNTVGAVQAVCLAAVTAGTLVYTVNKRRITTHRLSSWLACAVIGLALGCISSFLGIGGGPINLVVLYFFFSMDPKTAAANSLYIILCSQLASVLSTLASGAVPSFRPAVLALMVAGGIGGGMIGRSLNKRMDNRAVDRLFIGLMAVIIGISIYNGIRYAAA